MLPPRPPRLTRQIFHSLESTHLSSRAPHSSSLSLHESENGCRDLRPGAAVAQGDSRLRGLCWGSGLHTAGASVHSHVGKHRIQPQSPAHVSGPLPLACAISYGWLVTEQASKQERPTSLSLSPGHTVPGLVLPSHNVIQLLFLLFR